jgi:hypothetical protein
VRKICDEGKTANAGTMDEHKTKRADIPSADGFLDKLSLGFLSFSGIIARG